MSDQKQNSCLAQASADAFGLFNYWVSHGLVEHKGDSAAFAYQIAHTVFAGLTFTRHLETMPSFEAGEELVRRANASPYSYAEADVPDDHVVFQAMVLAHSFMIAMRSRRQGVHDHVNVNQTMRIAARDVCKLFGESVSKSMRRLAEADDAEIARSEDQIAQMHTLAYEPPAGRA